MNFASNLIEIDGVVHLAKALESNTTLHTIVLADNPGYNDIIGQRLDATAAVAHAKMGGFLDLGSSNIITGVGSAPAEVSFVLSKWLNIKVQDHIEVERANIGI